MKLLNTYSMNDDNTRRQVFWMLKRLSSYSLWKRKRDAWAVFADAYEKAVKTWPETDPDALDPNNLVYIYQALKLYDQGLAELRKGHRHVWRIQGDLYQLHRPVNLVRSFFYGPCHERWAQIWPYPPKVEAINKLRLKEEYAGSEFVLEASNMKAPLSNVSFLFSDAFYEYEFYSLPRPFFPKNLTSVPNVRNEIITTGDVVPCDGIWEPGYLTFDYKWKVIPVGVKDFINKGCFNYLVSGSRAPLIDNIDSDETKSMKIQWRLVWEDSRYCDGIVPDESEYFLKEESGKRITCQSGDICPYGGRWVTLAGEHQQYAQVATGSIMPQATRYQRDLWEPATLIAATWSLVSRDDGGSVFIASAS